MIDIGTTDFYFSAPQLSKSDLEKYSLLLFDHWEAGVEENLIIPDYSLSLEIEEGSIKGGGKLAASLTALYVGIATYGSFVSGLKIIKEQVVTVSDYLVQKAEQQLGSNAGPPTVRKRGGTLGSLQRLFVKVQRGEISPEQATKEAKLLLGENAEASPEFMDDLAKSFKTIPRFHQQIGFPFEEFAVLPSVAQIENNQKHDRPKTPRVPSRPSPPPASHLRVEVWRESKKHSKNFRTIII